nr:ATP-binding protein [Nocardioides sp. B-3]
MPKQTGIVRPDTRRVVEGLRDTGYTFPSAVADIVDNSIAAEATHVSVWVSFTHSHEPIVTIADNGIGMTQMGLENAMRYGSEQRKDPNSLGRFGLGLKTASTSFCRRLTVVSRDESGAPNAATWDLDDLASAGEWNLAIGDADESEADIFDAGVNEIEELGGRVASGTVVWWDKVDKLLKTKSGAQAKNMALAMTRTQNALEMHLRTVFQRFLDHDDVRAPNVVIGLNGKRLAASGSILRENRRR